MQAQSASNWKRLARPLLADDRMQGATRELVRALLEQVLEPVRELTLLTVTVTATVLGLASAARMWKEIGLCPQKGRTGGDQRQRGLLHSVNCRQLAWPSAGTEEMQPKMAMNS